MARALADRKLLTESQVLDDEVVAGANSRAKCAEEADEDGGHHALMLDVGRRPLPAGLSRCSLLVVGAAKGAPPLAVRLGGSGRPLHRRQNQRRGQRAQLVFGGEPGCPGCAVDVRLLPGHTSNRIGRRTLAVDAEFGVPSGLLLRPRSAQPWLLTYGAPAVVFFADQMLIDTDRFDLAVFHRSR